MLGDSAFTVPTAGLELRLWCGKWSPLFLKGFCLPRMKNPSGLFHRPISSHTMFWVDLETFYFGNIIRYRVSKAIKQWHVSTKLGFSQGYSVEFHVLASGSFLCLTTVLPQSCASFSKTLLLRVFTFLILSLHHVCLYPLIPAGAGLTTNPNRCSFNQDLEATLQDPIHGWARKSRTPPVRIPLPTWLEYLGNWPETRQSFRTSFFTWPICFTKQSWTFTHHWFIARYCRILMHWHQVTGRREIPCSVPSLERAIRMARHVSVVNYNGLIQVINRPSSAALRASGSSLS